MKFHRVEVDNWRPFRSQSSMDFAAAHDQPITLVFGKNGGGKTSMLTAIYWCLYGEMDLEEGKGEQNLVNNQVVAEASATRANPAIATVTLYVSRPTSGVEFLYRIRREQHAFEADGKRVEPAGGPLSVERVSPHGGYRVGQDVRLACDHPDSSVERYIGGEAQDKVERQLLPKTLAKYFFYPGETLSFPFRNDDKSTKSLRGFLREVSGGSKFAPHRDLIGGATRTLNSKSKARATADQETRRLQEDIDNLESALETNIQDLPALEEELSAAEQNRERVVAQLERLEGIQPLLDAAERAKQQENSARDGVITAERLLSEALGDAYLVVAKPLFEAVGEVFSKRKYPNDISSSLVEQLRETMKCICDRELTSEMIELLEPLSPSDDSVVARMHTLNSYASSLRVADDDKSAVDAMSVELDDALTARSEAIEARADAEASLDEAGANEFAEVDKTNLVQMRADLDSRIGDLRQEIGGLGRAIADGKSELDRKEKDKRASAPKSDQDVHRAVAIARGMAVLLEAIADKQADVARGQLEKLINDHYVVYKESVEVAVDSAFHVKILDRTGSETVERPVGDLSGSETALLTYGFAAAAAKLLPQYQTLDKLLTTVPDFAEVENIPLVVDAPFSNLGNEYKHRVMELMAAGFSQVIVFTEAADTDVLGESTDRIGAEYLVHFAGDLKDNVETTFLWRGQEHEYASDGGDERSTIHRIGS